MGGRRYLGSRVCSVELAGWACIGLARPAIARGDRRYLSDRVQRVEAAIEDVA
jgi:hypothetical protein